MCSLPGFVASEAAASLSSTNMSFLFLVHELYCPDHICLCSQALPCASPPLLFSLDAAGRVQQKLSSSPHPVCSEVAPLHNYISYRLNQEELRPHFATNSC